MAAPRTLTLVHFNDTYEVEARDVEPVGGAARLATKIKSFGPEALVLFSGDAFHPSLLSTVTDGKQMVDVLNACGVRAACVGNHDLDGGLEEFEERARECAFPWLMANIVDAETGLPLGAGGGVKPSLLLDCQGMRLGLVGLVEEEWLATLGSIDIDTIQYKDFVAEGARLAAELRAQGAELVIALTHMRLPNDMRLADGVPGIDLVLGGHDHEYYLLAGRAHATAIVKSGTDFRDCTEISLILSSPAAELVSPAPPATSSAAVAALAHLPSQLAQRCAEIADEAQERCSKWARLAAIPALTGCRLKAAADGAGASGAGAGMHACEPCGGDAEGASPDVAEAVSVYEACAAASLATSLVTTRPLGGAAGAPLLTVQAARHTITSELAEDAVVQEIVQRYVAELGACMGSVVGRTATDLDGRFSCVRTGESNLGNLLCDIWRQACHADVALLNGGTLRSDRIHPAGELTRKDLIQILPMLDESVVIEVSGSQLLAALENGLEQWPQHEGRFPQVSGIRFSFDGSLPPGQRVVPGSVSVGGADLQPDALYSLATKAYLAEGRDGYVSLLGAKLLRDVDCTPLLPTVLANHLAVLRMANVYLENTGRVPAWRRAAAKLIKGSESYAEKSSQRLEAAAVSRTARLHPLTGTWEVAPTRDGRITCVGGAGNLHGGSAHGGSAHGGSAHGSDAASR